MKWILYKIAPIGNLRAVKYDYGVHSKASVELAKWFSNYVNREIKGAIDAGCF